MGLVYGCMGLGGPWGAATYGSDEVDQAAAVIEAALAAGITRFDHADIYGHGKAEAVFGDVLSRWPGLRERITLQTKCGIRLADDDTPGHYDLGGESIQARVRESLDRLQVETVDVLLLHRPDPLTPPEEIAGAVLDLKRAGQIRAVGVSNMSVPQIASLQRHLDEAVVVNQLEMSLAHRSWVEDGVQVNAGSPAGFPAGMLEYAAEHGVELQAWGPLAQGRYTGRAKTPAERGTASLIDALARQWETTPETVLLWWLQRHPAGVVPVIGSTNLERIAACADAVRREPALTRAEWYELWVSARGAALP